ncbi:MAG: TolB family protein, partial [Solirubrobacteraceae bacterium]
MSVTDAPAHALDAEAEALFGEARRRARRRRLRRLAIALAIVAFGALVYGVGFASSTRPARPPEPGPFADRAAFAGHGRLAFVSQGRLWLLDGTRLEAVSRAGQRTADPQFAPDGRWLSYTTASGEEWIARADGSGARPIARAPLHQTWLPDGRLVAGGSIWRISQRGVPVRVAREPSGLVAWARDGSPFVFFASSGPLRNRVERLEVADSLAGPRTTWFQTRSTFTRASGIQGNELLDAAALPHREGILFQLDPNGSGDLPMDGLMLNELRGPH